MSKKGQLPPQFENFKTPWGPIGETVYRRTYSHRKADGRNETWPETVVRVVDGNLDLVDERFIEPDEREKLIGLLLPFGILPAGRHLNASGVKGRQFLFNCHASGWDPKEPGAHFSFLFDQLMQGGGVGANYSNRYLESMPAVRNSVDLHVICRKDHPDHSEFAHLLSEHDGEKLAVRIDVEDSREGWVKTVDELLRWAFQDFELGHAADVPVVVDVSGIRAKGELLKTSGGIACGPGPLVMMLLDFVAHLNGCVGRKLTSLDAMTLDHSTAACVVAGGKRRSSRMSVKNWKDPDIFEFINCKRQDGAHWSTNISVEVDDEFIAAYKEGDEHAKQVMRAVVLGKRLNGEPGFWNRSLAMKGEREPEQVYCPNPCGEINLYMWENCNLGHVNMEYFARRPRREMMEAYRLMTRWLIRATYGDIPQPRQREVVDRNRRIGVGFFGFHGWLALNGIKYSQCWKEETVHKVLKQAFETVSEESARYSKRLGIPCPVKNTALAPTGSTAGGLVGATTSGQSMMAPWFKRLIRFSDMDPELAIKKLEGYECFPDPDAKNTTIVVTWCEDPLVAKVRAAGWDPGELLEGQFDVPFEDSLRVHAMLQDLYADNAISYTINLSGDRPMPTEEEMEAAYIQYLPRLKGTTLYVDKSRKNAPIQPITKEQFDAHQGRKEVTIVEDACKNGCPVEPTRDSNTGLRKLEI